MDPKTYRADIDNAQNIHWNISLTPSSRHDDIYLLPAMMQYPVIDATTVRIAMDNIRKIDEEDITFPVESG